jgi:hypothetical protein
MLLALWQRTAERLVVNRRVKQWQAQDPADGARNHEMGLHCLINEMQVLVENGWKHL